MKCKAVIFDLDDTLYDFKNIEPLALAAVEMYCKEKLGIEADSFSTAFVSGKEYTKVLLGNVAASHNRLLYFQHMLEKLGFPPLPHSLRMYEIFWNEVLFRIKLFDGVIDLLESLKSRGVKIAICSDLTADIQHMKIEKLGLSCYIDVLVTSEETGVEKPDKRIFEQTLAKLGCAPQECVFIGDSYERDIIGAEDVGVEAVHAKGDFMELAKWLEI